jgi:hypothetical protein
MNSQVQFKIRLMTLHEQLDCLESFQPESLIQIEYFFNYLFDLISIISNEFSQEFRKKLPLEHFEEIVSELDTIKSELKVGIVLANVAKDVNQDKSINWFKAKKLPDISKQIKKRLQAILLKTILSQIQFK